MVRTPCCDKDTVTKGTWSAEEDATLKSYVEKHGAITNWITLPQKIGLNRCGKSCRLRWLNYLRPHIKHGKFTEEEDKIISDLYFSIGSRWSIMADRLPGRTDNDIKNYWNTKLKKKIAGDNKKTQKRPSFRGLNGDVGVDNSPPAFTITNGHLMSTSWPSNTELHSQQEFDEGLTPTGANLEHSAPIVLSFSTTNATTATCSSSSEGGASTSSALPDPMTGQLVFPINIAFSGGGATHGLTIPDPPMNDIIKDGQSTTCQFCFHDKGSSSNSHDLISNWHSMPDIGIDIDTDVHTTNMGMNIDINVAVGVGVDGGSTSTHLEPEASSTSLRELWDLLFDDSPTPRTSTATPLPVDVIDGPDDILRHHFENLGSWDDDATITSLISSLPVEDDNNVDLLSISCNYEDNFLSQDVLDQFS